MKKTAKAAISVFLSLLMLAGTVFTLAGCIGSPNITPRDRYIDARNGFVDALSRGPWKLNPRIEGADGTRSSVTVDFGEDAEPLTLNVYRAEKGDDVRELCEAAFGDESFSWCAERLGEETYESFPGTTDAYLLMDGDMKEIFSSLEKLYCVTSDGLIRLTDEYATPERIEVFSEDVEIDGKTASADKYVLTLEREALEEIRDKLIPKGFFDRIEGADGELDEVIDRVDGIEEFDLKEDSKLTVSFWQVRGATRKAEIAATGEGYAITLTALVRSDVDSVRIDLSLAALENGKLTLGLPASVSYTEKDGQFDWRFTVDAGSAVIPETDDIGVYGGGESFMPEFTGFSLRSAGTYGEGVLEGDLSAEISFAGGELTQSFSAGFTVERETPRGPVTFEITPGPEFGVDVKITGKTEAADYAPGEYDPKDAIRYSEAEGEDKERFDKFTEELTDALTRFGDALSGGLGSGFYPYESEYMPFDLYLSGGENEFYALNNYMSGYYIKDLPMTLDGRVATVDTPDGTLVLDLEARPETVLIDGGTFTCEYSDLEDLVFARVFKEGEDDLYSPSYTVALYDDPDMADLTRASIQFNFDFEREGDEFICYFPDGVVTFTYREGDGTVLIGGAEFETSVYGYGESD